MSVPFVDGPWANPANSIYTGVWAGRPDASTLPNGTSMFVTDIGENGGSLWRVASGVWRLANPTLLRSAAPSSGVVNPTVEQFLSALTLPQTALASLRWFEPMFLVGKVGTSQACTVSIREGTAGTAADTLFFNTGIFAAANTAFNSGDVRRWDTTAARFVRFAANAQVGRTTGSVSATPYPTSGQGPTGLAGLNVIFSLTMTTAAASTDSPLVTAFDIVGY